MNIRLASLVLAAVFLAGFSRADAPAPLLTTSGTSSYSNHGVTITLTETPAAALEVRLAFNLPDFSGSTGTGKDSPMEIVPGKWAAQFEAPNRLWLYDGLGLVRLYERTLKPRGFKASDSRSVTSLPVSAPPELRKFMSQAAKPAP